MSSLKIMNGAHLAKVMVTCPECGQLTGIEHGEDDFGSASIHCDKCRNVFHPEYKDGMYLTRHQYLQAVTREVEVCNGLVNVAGSEFKFSQYSFFNANIIVGRIEV